MSTNFLSKIFIINKTKKVQIRSIVKVISDLLSFLMISGSRSCQRSSPQSCCNCRNDVNRKYFADKRPALHYCSMSWIHCRIWDIKGNALKYIIINNISLSFIFCIRNKIKLVSKVIIA